jgi:hypothetical protein
VTLGQTNQYPIEAAFGGSGGSIDSIDVVVPVERYVAVEGGVSLRLLVTQSTCVGVLGIDLVDASHPHGAPLTARLPTPLSKGERSVIWRAPPSGDWVVRVAIRMRGPAQVLSGATDNPWLIYLFRLNTGAVAWANPVPSGADPGGVDVTPAVPCGPESTAGPPAAQLLLNETAYPGTTGSSRWRGVVVDRMPVDEVTARPPIALTSAASIEIEGAACAAGWQIEAGLLGDVDGQWAGLYAYDSVPLDDPGNASQNIFSVPDGVLGAYVIKARFSFESGDFLEAYWPVTVEKPPVAEASIKLASRDVPMVVGCGMSYQGADRQGLEICASSWPEPEGVATVAIDARSTFRSSVTGETLTGWYLSYTAEQESGPSDAFCDLISGNTSVGVSSIEIPAPPPGSWSVRAILTYSVKGGTYTVPYFVRIVVPGDPVACEGTQYGG